MKIFTFLFSISIFAAPAISPETRSACGKITLAFLALIFALPSSGCSKRVAASAAAPNIDYYTCTMHPSVRSQDPHGKCPICSMDLVPVRKKGEAGVAHAHLHAEDEDAENAAVSDFFVPAERQQQIGVTYVAVARRPLRRAIRSLGVVAPDKARRWEFVARAEGYVQQLFVTSPGEPVEAEQPLLAIYSPELLTAQREFVNLLQARDRAASPEARQNAERSVSAVQVRLEQWNVTAKQIADLDKTRKPSEFVTFVAPFRGVIEDVPAELGRKVMPGDRLVDVADLSVVWVWAEFFENEVPRLAKGLKATVSSATYPGRKFEGEISVVSPYLEPTRRTAKVRIDLPNPKLELHPGMYVDVELTLDAGEGLAIPESAVMPTGGRSLVFVDKGEGRLEPRFIKIGDKYGAVYSVTSGLKEGERVVAGGNFLIDAESKVQGAIKTFAEAPAE